MGSAASTDRAERRRRDRAPGHGEAPATGALVKIPEDAEAADGRRKGCKVSPEPKAGEEPAAALPGSPSFRIYSQDAAAVDALVAASDADDDSDEPARPTEMSLAIRKNDLAHGSGELPKSKESSGWMKFKGQAIVDAMYTLFVCRSKAAASARPPHHPPAAVAAKPHHPSIAASPPRHAPLPPRPAAPQPFL